MLQTKEHQNLTASSSTGIHVVSTTSRKTMLASAISLVLVSFGVVGGMRTKSASMVVFQPLSEIQFIAASVDPTTGEFKATSGTGAGTWGIWRSDPGPRGVRLSEYSQIAANGGITPDGWTFDTNDWWMEEHGLIMPKPDFPLPAGKYKVTGGREVTTVLTISTDGGWKLDDGARLYDVTHLPCRAARYTPNSVDVNPSPANADQSEFPVAPGGAMPPVTGYVDEAYSVIFILAIGN
jgi:hypothetical protein